MIDASASPENQTDGSGTATTVDGPAASPIHARHRGWIEARSLDPELAEKLGLRTVQRGGAAWLAVPYVEQGQVINHKYRRTSEKDHRMDDGAPLALWNVDCLSDPRVRSGQVPVVLTEGEWDAIAAMQAGCTAVVSVPNGAPGAPTANLDEAKRYEWVDRHANDLAQVKQFVFATDDDQAGHYLRSDLVALLGAERCSFVEYPFPCKDLNEVLAEYGEARVAQCVIEAKPFPIQGLYRISDFPEKGDVRSYDIGIDPIGDLIRIVPGTLTVLTGYANMGKSTMLNAIIGNALRYHFPVCVASFETDVRPILENGLRKVIMGCGDHDLKTCDTSDADDLIHDRLTIISQAVDDDMEMDLAKVLNLARTAVVRHGAKMLVIDPWNEMEHKRRRDETETDYIGRSLRMMKRFARQYDVALWVAAHPTKPSEGTNKVPGLYDISGSANWANKADYGLTYHRPQFDVNEAEIRVSKVRMGLPGKRGSAKVCFDFRESRFRSLDVL